MVLSNTSLHLSIIIHSWHLFFPAFIILMTVLGTGTIQQIFHWWYAAIFWHLARVVPFLFESLLRSALLCILRFAFAQQDRKDSRTEEFFFHRRWLFLRDVTKFGESDPSRLSFCSIPYLKRWSALLAKVSIDVYKPEGFVFEHQIDIAQVLRLLGFPNVDSSSRWTCEASRPC